MSLGEILLVVALVGILGMLIVFNVSSYTKRIRQNTLDANAQTVFYAAQSSLTGLFASGDLPELIKDCDEITSGETYYADSGMSASVTRLLFPENYLAEDLYVHNWRVEFDKSGIAIAAFYSEDLECAGGNISSPNIRMNSTERLNLGGKIGYYGLGNKSAQAENYREMKDETCSVKLVNKDELRVDVSSTADSIRYSIRGIDTGAEYVSSKSDYSTDSSGNRIFSISIDSLTSHFAKNPDFSEFRPGEDLEIQIREIFDSQAIENTAPVSVTVNSLFASCLPISEGSSDYIAVCRYGRQLQNLQYEYLRNAKYSTRIKRVKLDKSIDFSASSTEKDTWGYLKLGDFTPIINNDIDRFEGKTSQTITGLKVNNSSGNGGLFDTFAGTVISNINFVGARIKASGHAGPFAGKLINPGSVTVSDCSSYLMYADYSNYDRNKTIAENDKWIIASGNAGGLIGDSSEAGPVTLQNTFASTVVKTGGISGGLVGRANAITVYNSYSDCYLAGNVVGGLVGSAFGSASINGCYSAGFLRDSADHAAGLICSNASITNSYTIFDFSLGSAVNSYSVSTGGTTTNTKFINSALNQDTGEPIDIETLKASAGSVFYGVFNAAPETGHTTAYNIFVPSEEMQAGGVLDEYPYPMLNRGGDTVRHYGDWYSNTTTAARTIRWHVRTTESSSYSDYYIQADAKIGSAVIRPSDPSQTTSSDEYYRAFAGWSDQPDSGHIVEPDAEVTADRDYYAVFASKCDLELHVNGGAFNDNDKEVWLIRGLDYDSSITQPGAYKPGRTLAGWSRTESLDKNRMWDFDTDRIRSRKLVLYAKWIGITLHANKADNNTILYYADDSTSVMKLAGAESLAADGYASEKPVRAGAYELAGWYTESNGGTLIINADGTPARNYSKLIFSSTDENTGEVVHYFDIDTEIDLYAKWTKPTKRYEYVGTGPLTSGKYLILNSASAGNSQKYALLANGSSISSVGSVKIKQDGSKLYVDFDELNKENAVWNISATDDNIYIKNYNDSYYLSVYIKIAGLSYSLALCQKKDSKHRIDWRRSSDSVYVQLKLGGLNIMKQSIQLSRSGNVSSALGDGGPAYFYRMVEDTEVEWN